MLIIFIHNEFFNINSHNFYFYLEEREMKFLKLSQVLGKYQVFLILLIVNVNSIRKTIQNNPGCEATSGGIKTPALKSEENKKPSTTPEINKAISSLSGADVGECIKGIVNSSGISNNTYETIKSFATPVKQKPLKTPPKTKTNLTGNEGSESMDIITAIPTSIDNVDGNIPPVNIGDIDATNIETREETPSDKVNKKLTKIKVNWYNTNLKAQDIGANSQGDLYVVDVKGKLYKYEFLSDSFTHMEGDFELTKIKRVDVNWDGMPYVITETGDTYYLSCDHKWMRLPGCASDIGIGRGGEIYKTGCDIRSDGGYGIYRLYCSCPSTCCYKGCQNWKKPFKFIWGYKPDERTCEWFRIEGNGVKIDVAPSGNPYVIDYNGDIYQYDGTNWRKIPTLTKAYDLTVSNEGVLLFIGQDANIYKLADETKGKWIQLSGQGDAITAGPFTQPWVIRHSDKSVLGSAKFDYN
jgi:hypothetical protein